MAQNLDNLKKLVAKNIEAGGFLNSLRAQLKVEVYKIIESQDSKSKENVGFQWEHPLLNQIKGITEGMKSLELIVEYLEFFKLDYTAQVLRKEANFSEPIIRDTLAKKIGMSQSIDSLRPLLMILISEFSSGGSAANLPSPTKQAAQKQKYDTIATNAIANKKQEEELKKKQDDEQKKKQEENEKKKQLEDKKKQEEKSKKETEDQKKQKDRPQTAPVKPEPPAPIVNKIRGGPTKQNALSSMFGIDLGGGQQNEFEEDDIFSNKPKQPAKQQPPKSSNPYSFDGNGEPPNKKNQNIKTQKNMVEQQPVDPYAFDLDDQLGQPKKYDYDFNQTVGKKFNNPYTMADSQKGKPQKGKKNDEIEEDIDDYQESRDDRAKQSNQLFTSDDDYQKATQSLGVDESVDSLALEEYDYYEDVFHKK